MNTHEVPIAPPRNRWGLVLVVIACLFGCLLVVWFYLGHRNGRLLQRTMAETDEREPGGWQLEDLERQRRQVGDEENGGLFLHGTKKLKPARWPYWEGYTPTGEDEETSPEAFTHLQQIGELRPNKRLSPQQFNAVQNEVCRGLEWLDEIRKVADKPWGRYPIVYSKDGISTLLPYTQDARDYANGLNWEATSRAEVNDPDGALEDCRAILNCGRSIGDEPCLISVLVRIAVRAMALRKVERILAQGTPSDAALVQLDEALRREEAENVLIVGARGERAFLDRVMVALQRGDLTYAQVRTMMSQGQRGQLYGLEDWAFWATAGSPDVNRASFLHLNNRYVEIAGMPTEKLAPALAELQKEVENSPKFVKALFPATLKVSQAYLRVTAETRMIRCAIAAERYRQKHGKWPDTLAELVPQFLDAEPVDPHTAKPFSWKRRPDGWTIYIHGPDGQDDGGNLTPNYQKKGTDWGYRLYDLDQRRLPYEKLALGGEEAP